jgi:hypothetical protein
MDYWKIPNTETNRTVVAEAWFRNDGPGCPDGWQHYADLNLIRDHFTFDEMREAVIRYRAKEYVQDANLFHEDAGRLQPVHAERGA